MKYLKNLLLALVLLVPLSLQSQRDSVRLDLVGNVLKINVDGQSNYWVARDLIAQPVGSKILFKTIGDRRSFTSNLDPTKFTNPAWGGSISNLVDSINANFTQINAAVITSTSSNGGSSDSVTILQVDPAIRFITNPDTAQFTGYDASGRMRVSDQITYLSVNQVRGNDPDLIDQKAAGSGDENIVFSGGVVEMNITGPTGYIIRQSRSRAPYLSGKSQLLEFTFQDFDIETGVEKEVGYFSSSTTPPFNTVYDGLRTYTDGIDHYVGLYNNGILQNPTTDEQSAWLDPLDGTGPSGINYDWENFTIIYGDFLYLGGSTVRLWIHWEGKLIPFFHYTHAGKTRGTIFNSPQQPIRYGVRHLSGNGTFGMICYAVSSEGGTNVSKKGYSISMPDDDIINANTAGTRYAVKGIRLNNITQTFNIISISVQGVSNDKFRWELVLNPTIAGTPAWSAMNNYPMDEGIGDVSGNPSSTTVTGGQIMRCGYVQENASITLDLRDLAQRAGTSIDGTFDEVWLVLTPMTSNLDCRGAIDGSLFQ